MQTFVEKIKTSGCALRWGYPIIRYDQPQIGTCCQVLPLQNITAEDLQKLSVEELFNNPYFVSRRLEMLDGIKHSDCKACWKLEDQKFMSLRQRNWPIETFLPLGALKDRSFEDVTSDEKVELARFHKPYMIELHLDTVCDLSCVYCGPGYSSTWARKLGVKSEKCNPAILDLYHEKIWQWYERNSASVQVICLIGGEPMLSPYLLPILSQLEQIEKRAGKSDFRKKISITSNFNSRPALFERFLKAVDALDPLFQVTIHASCESIGAPAEFIREGLNWDQFEKNVRTFLDYLQKKRATQRECDLHFSFNAAPNALSITHMPDFLRWAVQLEEEYQVPINILKNIVTYPEIFSAQSVLPQSFSTFCDEALSVIRSKKNSFGYYLAEGSWESYSEFLQTISYGLKSRNPAPYHREKLKSWVLSLTADRFEKFHKNFPELSASLEFENAADKFI